MTAFVAAPQSATGSLRMDSLGFFWGFLEDSRRFLTHRSSLWRWGFSFMADWDSPVILPLFYRILSDSTGFYWILLDSTGFYWILLDSTRFCRSQSNRISNICEALSNALNIIRFNNSFDSPPPLPNSCIEILQVSGDSGDCRDS